MRGAQHLEASLQRVLKSLTQEQARRARQHDLQGASLALIGVPEPLHHVGPSAHLLHLVEHENGWSVRIALQVARLLPLRPQPFHVGSDDVISARRVGGLVHSAGVCAIAVDLPVWWGPATTWMRGLSSSRILAAMISTILRWNIKARLLLFRMMMCDLTQYNEQK